MAGIRRWPLVFSLGVHLVAGSFGVVLGGKLIPRQLLEVSVVTGSVTNSRTPGATKPDFARRKKVGPRGEPRRALTAKDPAPIIDPALPSAAAAGEPSGADAEEPSSLGQPDPDKYRYEKRVLSGFKVTRPREKDPSWTAQPTYEWVEKNILSKKCYFCHVSKGPVLIYYEALMSIVVPGRPLESRLYEMGFVGKMPKGHTMTDEEKWALYHWIRNGADR